MNHSKSQDSHSGDFYPLFFAAYPIIYLYSKNPTEISFWEFSKLLAVFLMGVALVRSALLRLLQNADQVNLFTAVAGFALSGYGIVYETVSEIHFSSVHPFRHKTLLPLLALLLVLISWPKLQLGRRLRPLVRSMATILVCLGVGQILITGYATYRKTHNLLANPFAQGNQASGPSFVLIILDEYARADILKRDFEFDNQPFLEQLSRRGFLIAGHSRSNYPWTPPSLSSILNCQYAPETAGLTDAAGPWIALVNDNWVMKFFKARGYRIEASSFSSVTDHIPLVDYYWDRDWLSAPFLETVRAASLAAILNDSQSKVPFWVPQRKAAILLGLERLKKLQFSQPTFALVHILCPHRPLVLARPQDGLDGLDLKERDARYKTLYPAQIQVLNEPVLAGLDHLLSLKPPPVIILMSDHGSQLQNVNHDSSFSERKSSFLEERMANLCAIYVPDGALKQAEVDELVGVNVFRLLFNRFFDTRAEILPARFFWLDGKDDEITHLL